LHSGDRAVLIADTRTCCHFSKPTRMMYALAHGLLGTLREPSDVPSVRARMTTGTVISCAQKLYARPAKSIGNRAASHTFCKVRDRRDRDASIKKTAPLMERNGVDVEIGRSGDRMRRCFEVSGASGRWSVLKLRER
jgi:hypothetical protein